MTEAALLALTQRALLLCLTAALPPLAVAALCGWLVDLLQSRLGIGEPSPPALARLLGGLLTLLLMAPWLGGELARFAATLWAGLPLLGR